jgi:hypothetical protein
MRIESIAHQYAHRKYCASICALKVLRINMRIENKTEHQYAHQKQYGASICTSKAKLRIQTRN